MKSVIRKKKKKKDIYNDSWLYIILLSTIVILGEALKTYTFNIGDISLTYTIFLLPIMLLLTNYIIKKSGYRTAIAAICLSAVAMVLFVSIINFALGRTVSLMAIGGELSGYVCAQLVSLNIYLFLLNNTKSPAVLVWLNYLFALIVFYMFYTLINLKVLVTETYWIGYFITLALQAVECFGITLIDKKIKRGLEKE